MARNAFGGSVSDYVVSFYTLGSSKLAAFTAATLTFFDAETGGNQVTDLALNADGSSPVTQVNVPATGDVPTFYGPDGVTQLWVSANGSASRVKMVSLEAAAAAVTGAQAAASEAAGHATDAASSATAAEQAAASVPATTDAAMAPVLSDPESASAGVLSAAYGPVGANTARFVQRARAGENLKITCVGDSILEGQTVTNPATDGTMILLAADLSTRFGITVTQTNNATSGFTALRALVDGNVAQAVTDNADLYIVSAFDKNDLGAEINGTGGLYAPGYPQTQSLASIERIVRGIRRDVPKADIIILATNPYTPGSSSNTNQDAKDIAVQRVAAAYGCEFVNANAPFKALGDWSALMFDSTHPNTAGHRLIADTILAHLENRDRTTLMPGAASQGKGIYGPEKVKETIGNYGTLVTLVTATDIGGSGVSWANTGTWTGTGGSSAYTTTTTGSYTEVVGQFSELHLLISTADADDPVATITVDGVDVATGQHFNAGKQGNYYVPIAVGLDPSVSHTVRVTRTGGTLKIQRAAFVRGTAGQFTPETRMTKLIPSTATTTTLTTTTSSTLASATLSLPSGWKAMDVYFTGKVTYRNSGATTAQRTVTVRPLFNSTDLTALESYPVPVQSATQNHAPARFTGIVSNVTANGTFAIRAYVDNATDTIQALQWNADAILVRTA